MKKRNKIFVLLISLTMLFSACSTWGKLNDTERGAVIGGGTGAVIGGAVAPGLGGAVVGGALGAVGGGLIGNEVKKNKEE